MAQHDKLFLGFAALAVCALVIAVYLFVLSDEPVQDPDNGETAVETPLDEEVEKPVDPAGGTTDAPGEEETAEPSYTHEQMAPIEIDVYQRGQVLGKVVDEKKNPVTGAVVYLYREQSAQRRVDDLMLPVSKELIQTSTDSQGTFFITNIPAPGRYGLMAAADGYQCMNRPLVKVKPRQDQTAPDLVLGKGWRIFGVVTDSAGSPLPEARVFLELNAEEKLDIDRVFEEKKRTRKKKTHKEWQEETFNAQVAAKKRTVADEAGRFDFGVVASGSYRVGAVADGYSVLVNMNVATSEENRRDGIELALVLEPAMTIAGRVVDKDRNSIGGVEIVAEKARDPSTHSWSRAFSADDNGTFVLENLMPGRYMISARKRGYTPEFASNIEAGTASLLIRMPDTSSISGMVVDARTGKGLKEFSVAVCSLTSSKAQITKSIRGWERFKSNDGSFKVDSLQWGRFQLIARSDDAGVGRSEPVDLEMGQQAGGMTIKVSRGYGVQGKVVDGRNKPVKGARVSLFKGRDGSSLTRLLGMDTADVQQGDRSIFSWAVTGEGGEFDLMDVDPGVYNLRVVHPDYRDEVFSDVGVDKKARNYVGKITVKQGGKLEGMVYDVEGKPGAGVMVRILGPSNFLARSDERGAFHVVKMPPGQYKVSSHSGSIPFGGNPGSGLTAPDSIPVYLAEGETSKVEVHLR